MLAQAAIKLLLDNSEFRTRLEDVQDKLDRFRTRMQGVTTQARYLLAGLGGFGALAVRNATVQIAAETKLEAVLKATGNATRLTANEMKRYASELQNVTAFGDDAIIGVQTTLAAFGTLAGTNFRDATKAALDLSTAMNVGLNEAAKKLGKALADPITGVGELKEAGIVFTAAQKEQIKAMVEAGNVAGAQALILDALRQKTGGAAEAIGDTFAGRLARLKNELGDVTEIIGVALIPTLERAVAAIRQFLPGVARWASENSGLIVGLGLTATATAGLLAVLPLFLKAVAGATTVVGLASAAISAWSARLVLGNPIILATVATLGSLAYAYHRVRAAQAELDNEISEGKAFAKLNKELQDARRAFREADRAGDAGAAVAALNAQADALQRLIDLNAEQGGEGVFERQSAYGRQLDGVKSLIPAVEEFAAKQAAVAAADAKRAEALKGLKKTTDDLIVGLYQQATGIERTEVGTKLLEAATGLLTDEQRQLTNAMGDGQIVEYLNTLRLLTDEQRAQIEQAERLTNAREAQQRATQKLADLERELAQLRGALDPAAGFDGADEATLRNIRLKQAEIDAEKRRQELAREAERLAESERTRAESLAATVRTKEEQLAIELKELEALKRKNLLDKESYDRLVKAAELRAQERRESAGFESLVSGYQRLAVAAASRGGDGDSVGREGVRVGRDQLAEQRRQTQTLARLLNEFSGVRESLRNGLSPRYQ